MFRALFAIVAAAMLSLSPAFAEVVLNRGNSGGEPNSLDPHFTQGTWENFIVGDLLEGLVTEDLNGELIPGAAESWTVSPDGLTWTFKMRKGAVWSDGTPVTANDFVFSWKRLLDPAIAAQYASILYPVKNAEAVNGGTLPMDQLGISAPDAETLVVTLDHPAPYFDGIVAHQATFPVPSWQVEKHGRNWISPGNFVSNGPFTLRDRRVNEYVRLAKNPSYYDAANVKVDVVNWIPQNDFTSGVKQFRIGEFDIYDAYPNQQFRTLKAELGDQVTAAPYLGVSYVVFNQRRKPFDDVRVRKALSLAIDRQTITERIYQLGEPVACALVPPETANYEKGASSPDCAFATQPERVAAARALLEEAGYGPSNSLSFTLNTTADSDARRAAAVMQAMWRSIGVRVELETNQPSIHYNQHLQTANFEVGTAAWIGDYNDPETFLFMFETSNKGFNYGGWSNAQYDELMRQQRLEPDAVKRAGLMRQAEQILLDDYGAAPTRFRLNPFLVKPYLKGWVGNIRGVNRSRWMSIEGR